MAGLERDTDVRSIPSLFNVWEYSVNQTPSH